MKARSPPLSHFKVEMRMRRRKRGIVLMLPPSDGTGGSAPLMASPAAKAKQEALDAALELSDARPSDAIAQLREVVLDAGERAPCG